MKRFMDWIANIFHKPVKHGIIRGVHSEQDLKLVKSQQKKTMGKRPKNW